MNIAYLAILMMTLTNASKADRSSKARRIVSDESRLVADLAGDVFFICFSFWLIFVVADAR